jgi:hypothetical protein
MIFKFIPTAMIEQATEQEISVMLWLLHSLQEYCELAYEEHMKELDINYDLKGCSEPYREVKDCEINKKEKTFYFAKNFKISICIGKYGLNRCRVDYFDGDYTKYIASFNIETQKWFSTL